MIHHTPHYRRIACLCTEAVETLYLLGAEDLVAGISGFTVYPPEARQQKPKISGFSSGKLEKILAVEPDLVVGYSSLQSDMLKEVAEAGVDILHFNHHSVDGVLRMVRVLGSLTGRLHAAELLCEQLEGQISAARLEAAARDAAGLPRPLVYFEEWHDPIISGIGWVGELIALAGGRDAFAELAGHARAKERIVADPQTVIDRQPDLMVGSWCGKRFRPETVVERNGWQDVPAVRNADRGHIIEIKSADILAPGPTLITRGLPQLQALIRQWHEDRAG